MQKETVEVIINEGGLTCTTTNQLGERPKLYDCWSHVLWEVNLELWQQAENDRITYEIVTILCSEHCDDCLFKRKQFCDDFRRKHFKIEPGTIRQARIENGKAVIL